MRSAGLAKGAYLVLVSISIAADQLPRRLPTKSHRHNNDSPRDHILLTNVKPHNNETIVDGADQQGTDESSYNRPFTPKETGSTQDGRRDNCQLGSRAKVIAGCLHHAGIEHSGQSSS